MAIQKWKFEMIKTFYIITINNLSTWHDFIKSDMLKCHYNC